MLTVNTIDKRSLAKADEEKKKTQLKYKKEHAAQSGARTRGLSHFVFVGDRINRGRSIYQHPTTPHPCLVCLNKVHAYRGRSATVVKSKRDSEQPVFFCPPEFRPLFSKKERTVGLIVPADVIVCCYCCLLGVGFLLL